ncbi:MAG TPA: hypothetical protein VHE30_13545, partial [Polyangiaceae bacterium]|nr:hypothetical protein [Polyangiaceae bacterium]
MNRRVLLSAALAVAGCDGSPALTSDPAYWNPPKTGEVPTADPLSPDAEVPVPAGCDETPPFDPALTVSVAGGA